MRGETLIEIRLTFGESEQIESRSALLQHQLIIVIVLIRVEQFDDVWMVKFEQQMQFEWHTTTIEASLIAANPGV